MTERPLEDIAAIAARHQGEHWCRGVIAPSDGDLVCDTEKMRRALAEAEALLHPIEWWICVWCETKYPYDDGPDTLKAHSAVCAKHPANIALDAERALADRLAEALTRIDVLPADHYRKSGFASPSPWVYQRDVGRIARAVLDAYHEARK